MACRRSGVRIPLAPRPGQSKKFEHSHAAFSFRASACHRGELGNTQARCVFHAFRAASDLLHCRQAIYVRLPIHAGQVAISKGARTGEQQGEQTRLVGHRPSRDAGYGPPLVTVPVEGDTGKLRRRGRVGEPDVIGGDRPRRTWPPWSLRQPGACRDDPDRAPAYARTSRPGRGRERPVALARAERRLRIDSSSAGA
jgi:hypothetical protein